MRTLLFTHIPKTAGTSLHRHVLRPNIPIERIDSQVGLKSIMRKRDWSDCALLTGHYQYGVHLLMRRRRQNVAYLVMLRDPAEHALSFYHFIRTTKSPNYEHPAYHDATTHSLTEFYALPKYRNLQTRFVAGLFWHRCYKYLAASAFDSLMLKVAKYNLRHRYNCYGLTEHFEDSARMIAHTFGWNYEPSEERYKQTPSRPTAADLPAESLQQIRHYNQLDFELYDYAQEHFEAQSRYIEAFG